MSYKLIAQLGYSSARHGAARIQTLSSMCNKVCMISSLQTSRVVGSVPNSHLFRIDSRYASTDSRNFHNDTAAQSQTQRNLSNAQTIDEEIEEDDEERPVRSKWNDRLAHNTRSYKRSAVEDVSWKKSSDVPDEKIGAFSNFRMSEPIINKLKGKGIPYLFPVQTNTFNEIYDGNDVIVQAPPMDVCTFGTGSGKTLSYVLPLVEKMLSQTNTTSKQRRSPRLLVMAPTRELARQVSDVIESLTTSLSVACIYGGAAISPQESQLRSGVDVVVGTPGRIQDMLERGALSLSSLEHVVLDEVDRMLDMGFANDVDDILRHRYVSGRPEDNPQTLLFSATVPSWVQRTARRYLSEDLIKVDLVGSGTVRTATTVEHLSICCPASQRTYVIADMLKVYSGSHGRAIVFCETKREADALSVSKSIRNETHVLHGDIPQGKREIVLKGFREGRYKVLIATDVAARGLDIPEVDLVIQCCPPKDVESYIHRSGRTGRAGRAGVSVLLYQPNERQDLQDVQRRAGIKFKSVSPPKAADIAMAAAEDAIKTLEKVDDTVADRFSGLAQSLVEKHGAVMALSAALAVVSGAMDEPDRSLITNRQDYVTYLYRSDAPVRRLRDAYSSMEEKIAQYEKIREHMSSVRLLADNSGCVFDVPTELSGSIETSTTLQRASELPDLVPLPPSFSQQRQGGGFYQSRGREGEYSGGSRGRFQDKGWNRRTDNFQRSTSRGRVFQRNGLYDELD